MSHHPEDGPYDPTADDQQIEATGHLQDGTLTIIAKLGNSKVTLETTVDQDGVDEAADVLVAALPETCFQVLQSIEAAMGGPDLESSDPEA